MIGYRAPAVQKAFMLLETVAKADEGIGISKISNDLGFSKGTTHGIIQALLDVGALDQSPYRKKLYLGASLGELAKKAKNYYGITESAQPIIDKLGQRIQETVFLLVLNRSRGTIIAMSRDTKPLGISSSPGSTIPLLSGAVGKAFLASLKKKDSLKMIREMGLKAFTKRSIVEEAVYLKALQEVSEKGYALDDEEYLTGIRAMAVNLGNCRGLPLVMWVVGFATTMRDNRLPAMAQNTLLAAQELSRLNAGQPTNAFKAA
jgi:DNA-binding IclR family transcriptional regulator